MKGGEWLTRDVPDVFTPERLSDEHRLVAQTAAEFVAQEVLPQVAALEQKNFPLIRALLKRCGDLGLIGTDVPERVGGVELDKAASVIVTEAMGAYASFAAAFGAQSGLAIIPLLCFGNDEQQQRYLPRIVSGELIGAYCLSESGSGSDALSARARATRAPDGSWRLSGEKLWITNGGFADLFVVFAKVDGEQFSAFIVDRDTPGLTIGKEEHKMGLHGSSTTPVILQDARVPAANLLGEIGRAHKIAFNVLNYGRFKLGAMCTGAARAAIGDAAAYALTRRQFGEPIANFGAIRHKLGEMAVRLYAAESMLYRTAGLLDTAIGDTTKDGGPLAAALEEFAIEASIVKVACSEMADYVLDENVQIHGGNGFVHDYPAERRYRDARVNRIFEGTNEINRLIIPTTLIKRGYEPGEFIDEPENAVPAPLADACRTVRLMKGSAVTLLTVATKTFGDRLKDEQEALMLIADAIIETFGADSVVARATAAQGSSAGPLHLDAASTFVHDAALRASAAAQVAFESMQTAGQQYSAATAVRKSFTPLRVNTIATRRRLADAVISKKGYPFVL